MKKAVVIFFMFLTFSCISKSFVKKDQEEIKAFTVNKVVSIIDNIDYTFWNSPTFDRSLFYNFFIYYNENDIKPGDIESCKVYNQHDTNWTIDISKYFDSEKQYIGGYGRWFDTIISNNGSVLMIKDLLIGLKYKGGVLKYSFSINSPNSNINEHFFVYNEDYKGQIINGYCPVIKKAKILRKEKSDNGIKIEFSIDDNRVCTGEIWIYNSDNKSFAEAKSTFVNEYSKEISKYLNGGKDFYTDGRINTLVLKNEDIEFNKKENNFNEIVYCHIMLKDGLQKDEITVKKNTIYRSISERIIF